MSVIEIKNLTKDYKQNRGIFNINLNIEKGEMIGFVGTNGAGKTTTIRSILGFIKPTEGACYVNGLEAWNNSAKIMKNIGYVPGEIAFPDLHTGIDFLKSQAEFKGVSSLEYADELIEQLQLDPKANLKRMSKGMKQKTALVAALMNDCDIIILDEPTTGLDPLMRQVFMEIIKKEHSKGKTILMSSHIFAEMEDSCDRVALINEGRIVDIVDMKKLHARQEKDFKIEFLNRNDYLLFKKLNYTVIRDQEEYNQVVVQIKNEQINTLFKDLKNYQVKFIFEVEFTLEKYFHQVMKEKEGK